MMPDSGIVSSDRGTTTDGDTMKQLRAGVIGAGSWALAAHLPALAARPEVELVAVCRQGGEALARVAELFSVPVASEDYRDVIAQDLDIVVVASPSALHHEHAKAALLCGAHVLCEKPMTIDTPQAWDLVETSERVGRELLLSFGWNYMPFVRKAVDLATERGIGRLEHLSIHMSSATRELLTNTGAYPDASPDSVPEQATWTDPSLSGGGYGQAQLSHALGLAFALIPDRVSEVFAFTASPGAAPVELHDAAALRFDAGGVGVLSGGSSHVGAWDNKHELEVRAIGSEGQLIVDVHRELAWFYHTDGSQSRVEAAEGDGLYQAHGPVNALVDVALGVPGANRAPGRLGALTVETLELLYASARSGAVARR